MNTRARYLFVSFFVSAVSLGLAVPPAADAGPLQLQVISPQPFRGYASVQFDNGWPIALRITSRHELGIATNNGDPYFPSAGDVGYIVFADPNDCLTLVPPFRPATECMDLPTDETFLSFTPDVDQAGVMDMDGDPALLMQLTDSGGGGRPTFIGGTSANPTVEEVGPRAGGDTIDGFGYGPDDDCTGCVLLVEAGVGLVLDQNFDRVEPLTQRNLSGFFNVTGYELNSTRFKTNVLMQMTVPRGLVAPLAKADTCVGDPVLCDEPMLWRIDGGPAIPIDPQTEPTTGAYRDLLERTRIWVTAFVVSGTAPTTLADVNADGKVDWLDARDSGYNVLSNQVEFEVDQVSGNPCFGGNPQVFLGDLDGNGEDTGISIVCPAGSGGITRPPR